MKQIKYLRLKYQLTQSELAQLLHVSQQTIYKYESGNSQPPLSILKDICRIFQMSMDQFLGLTDPHIPLVTMHPCIPSEKSVLQNYRMMNEDDKSTFVQLSYQFSNHYN